MILESREFRPNKARSIENAGSTIVDGVLDLLLHCSAVALARGKRESGQDLSGAAISVVLLCEGRSWAVFFPGIPASFGVAMPWGISCGRLGSSQEESPGSTERGGR
jgi:hypothetical protein